jgi:D-alanyl-lipoteichoic acid acyltransferase DltB (MBOAT superfamily)
MAITSFYFLCFYAVLLLVYYTIPKNIQWTILLSASLLYYIIAGSLISFVILDYGIVVTYIGARLIERSNSEKKKKYVAIITVSLTLLILVILKYVNFFIYTFRGFTNIIGISTGLNSIQWLVPLGISFYTLIIIGYVIDVYRGVTRAQVNIAKYALYACYFPQMISGPFTRYPDMESQLYTPHRFDYKIMTSGMQRMLLGFFKKLVISERMAVIVNTVYSDYTSYSGFIIAFATICFAIQLYTDFSGCMDVVLGLSESLGISLPENFKTPFFSRSISEYWRRWHITLGTWFKDYVFYPLLKSEWLQQIGKFSKNKFGKKAGKKIPTYIGMFILWFTVGLWHGGSWNFIIGSGLLHWFYIVAGEQCEPLFKKLIHLLRVNTECFSWKLFQGLRTFSLVCIGFVFFRASSMSSALHMIKYSVFNPISKGITFKLGLDNYDINVAIISVAILLIVSILQQLWGENRLRDKIAEQNLVFRWVIWYAILLIVIIVGYYGPGYKAAEFIYQGF